MERSLQFLAPNTLRGKMLVFVVLFALLAVGSSVLQTARFRNLLRSTDELQNVYESTSQEIGQLRDTMLGLFGREKTLWLRGGKSESVDTQAVPIEAARRDIAALRQQLQGRPLSDDVRSQLARFDVAYAEYVAAYDTALVGFRADIAAGNAATADERADAIMFGKGTVVSQTLSTAQTLIEARTEEVRSAQRQEIAQAQLLALGSQFIAFAYVFAVALWFVASVGRRVLVLRDATLAIRRGKRDTHVPVGGTDELAELGGAFNAMVRTIGTQERRLEELRRLALALTQATSEYEACDIVVGGLAETFGFRYVSVYLLRPGDTSRLWLVCQRGYESVIDPVPVETSVTGRAVRERRPILTDLRKDRQFMQAEAQITCEAVAPILAPNRALGSLLLEAEHVGDLTEDDLQLITTLATNLAGALENVRLNAEARARIQQLAGANRDLAAVTATGTRIAALLSPDPIIGLVATELSAVLEAPTLYISLYDPECRTIRMHVARDDGEEVAPFDLTLDNSITGWLIRKREPLMLTTQAEVDAFVAREGVTSLPRYPASLIGVPLVAGAEIVGAVLIGNPKPAAFSYQQFSVAQTVAAQAATAIHNAHLYAQVRQQVEKMGLLNLELARANQLKSEFLATMSHELRTPLNAVIGFAQLIVEGAIEDPEIQRACVEDILQSGQHLLTLINDILDISKIEAGHMELLPEQLDLCVEIAEVARLMQSLVASRGHTLHLPPPEVAPVWVKADRQRLRQILLNLLSNAIKFTPDGGALTIEVVPRVAGATRPMAGVRVRDTGIGIRGEDFDILFEKFRQIDGSYTRKYEGTGLGLALTKQLVELHGGEISVTSTPDEGSTFTFTVPLAENVGAFSPPAAPAQLAAS